MPLAVRRRVRWFLAAVGMMPQVPAGPDYLQRQVLRSWKKESRQLVWFGLRDGMSILDLGCGPGHFTGQLADWLPAARITALDAEPRLLDSARHRLGRVGDGRIAFVEARADATGLPAESFDFVIARFLFQHLADPARVAREAGRILKPGGRLVVIDVDDGLFGVVEPRVPGLRRLLASYGDAQAQRGGNRLVARMLPRLLRDTGYRQVELDGIAIHSDEAGLAECFPQLDPSPLQALVASGHLSAQQFTELRAAHQAFVASGEPAALILLFMACGVKPVETATGLNDHQASAAATTRPPHG